MTTTEILFSVVFCLITFIEDSKSICFRKISRCINTIKSWKMYLSLNDYRQDVVRMGDDRRMDVEAIQLRLYDVWDHIQAFFRLNQIVVDDLVHHSTYNAKGRKKIEFRIDEREKKKKLDLTRNGLQFSRTYRPAELRSSQSNRP